MLAQLLPRPMAVGVQTGGLGFRRALRGGCRVAELPLPQEEGSDPPKTHTVGEPGLPTALNTFPVPLRGAPSHESNQFPLAGWQTFSKLCLRGLGRRHPHPHSAHQLQPGDSSTSFLEAGPAPPAPLETVAGVGASRGPGPPQHLCPCAASPRTRPLPTSKSTPFSSSHRCVLGTGSTKG